MQSHEMWLTKAKRDLKVSKILLHTADAELYDDAMYHTQQCAEKSLKAYLALQKYDIQKTHNLLRLVNLCAQSAQDFEILIEAAAFLNPFSTKFRYPDDMILDPCKDEVAEAITSAEKILLFIENKIKKQTDKNMRLF